MPSSTQLYTTVFIRGKYLDYSTIFLGTVNIEKIVIGEKGFLGAILALSATALSTYHTVVSEGHTGVSYEPDGPEDV